MKTQEKAKTRENDRKAALRCFLQKTQTARVALHCVPAHSAARPSRSQAASSHTERPSVERDRNVIIACNKNEFYRPVTKYTTPIFRPKSSF